MLNDNNPYTVKDLTQMMDDLRQLYPEVKLYEQWDAQEEVLLDKTKMETFLLNLIENSIKYGGTDIQCNISTNDKHYIFSVIDNGIGIAKDQQKDIFKKFYRIREGNIHNTTGLGIGLYQVQQIVESLNGQININSKPQKGTTFIITIPYV